MRKTLTPLLETRVLTLDLASAIVAVASQRFHVTIGAGQLGEPEDIADAVVEPPLLVEVLDGSISGIELVGARSVPAGDGPV